MKALRIIVKQNQAHYRKEESIANKMTYPLPPFSTVIGALHAACDFTEYHPMNLSIQGSYGSLQQEPYTDQAFLNSVMDDRGILVKLSNPAYFSAGHQIVAKAQKSQGNSFANNITISTVRPELLEEYRALRQKRKILDEEKKVVLEPVKELDEKIKKQKEIIKNLKEDNSQSTDLKNEIKCLTEAKKKLLDEFKNKQKNEWEFPYSFFASLTTSLRYYEVLYDVKLILHIHSDDLTLKTIQSNICNLTAIGRSEDFVEVISCGEVDISQQFPRTIESRYGGYISYYLAKNGVITLGKGKIDSQGTVYALNKNYEIIDGKRQFHKVWAVYTDNYEVDKIGIAMQGDLPASEQNSLFYDGEYIVNLM